MADYIPIPQQAQAPDGMKPISSLLNVVSGIQGLQAQKLAMQGQDQQNQAGAINLQEKQGLQGVMSNPSQWQNPDGSTDYNRLIPQVLKVAPTTGMDMVNKIATTEKAATDAKQTIQNLGASQRQVVGQYVASMTGQSPDKIGEGLDALTKQYPELAPATSYAKTVFSHLDKTGGQPAVDQGLNRFAQMTMTPTEQQTYNTPNAVAIGNGIQTAALNTKPGVAGIPQGGIVPGSTQTQLVPLAQQQGIGTDINNNPVVTHRDAYGNVQAPTAMPGANQGAAPPMISYPSGESAETKKALEGEALTAKNTALAAPQMHNNNQGILHELNNVSSTGVTGNLVAKAESLFGAGNITGSNDAERAASAYDLLGKYTERNALAAAAAQGPGTNAGLEAAIKANGSAAYNPTALKTVTQLNDAVVTGSEKYAQGLQAAIENGGKGVFAKRKFDEQWAQNADVNTLKYLNAYKTGDQAQTQEVLKAVGGPGSPGAKRLAQQLQNLQSLTTKGSL